MGNPDSLGGIKWSSHDGENAQFFCNDCGSAWSESERLAALKKVRWKQTRPFVCCEVYQEPEQKKAWKWSDEQHCDMAVCEHCSKPAVSPRHAGFWASRLYSPFQDIPSVAREFLDVRKNPHRLKQFVNTVLAELWDEPSEEVKHGDLLSRREAYASEVPDFVHTLVAGIDTQGDRLECTILGIGKDDEIAVIDHRPFYGDTSGPEPWAQLDEFLLKTRTRRDGVRFSIQAAAVDSGGNRTQAVYDFVRARNGRRVWAIRGKADTPGKRSPIWPTRPTLRSKGRVPLYEVGTQSAKFVIKSHLQVQEPGPRFVHFPDFLEAQYFAQLNAERLVTRYVGGAPHQVWHCPDGVRNEALDCFVYALAAYQGLLQAGFKPVQIPMGQIIEKPKKEDEHENKEYGGENKKPDIVTNASEKPAQNVQEAQKPSQQANTQVQRPRPSKHRQNPWLAPSGSGWFSR
jgi:phage terminase large subunit GpA-like protein